MKSAWLLALVSLVVGGAAGLAGGAYMLHAYKPEPQIKVIERHEVDATRSELLSRALRGSAETAERSSPNARVAGDEQPVLAQATEPRSPQEIKAEWQRQFAERVERVQQEARDPSWARQVENAFQTDFAKERERFQADLVSLECKSSACLAKVKWASYTLAQNKFPQIMHTAYATNCAVAVDIGDAPTSPDQPHQGTVVFHCDRSAQQPSSGG